jgi:hypothetical protein
VPHVVDGGAWLPESEPTLGPAGAPHALSSATQTSICSPEKDVSGVHVRPVAHELPVPHAGAQ